ncbi:type II toxin-antitoxin system RelB family antitoxin [Chryseomicrobium aureum]|uniref:type II toxin-antitoxin system RelB family antitoxin n=1 Tax=Chryseomicrobium aureum TaxID=1441723 RepID=UPI00370DBC74
MTTISLRVDNRDSKLIRDYAKLKNTSVSNLMRTAIIEKIEDELDVENFDRALASMENTHSFDDVKKELGL